MARATRALVLALDVGTTGVRALLSTRPGAVAAQAYRETLPACPAPGPRRARPRRALRPPSRRSCGSVLERRDAGPGARRSGSPPSARTAVVWDAASGRPLGPALSWQDMRTAGALPGADGAGPDDHARSWPPASSSGSSTAPTPTARGVRAGRIRCGTLDAWLAARLTGGRVQATDASNASCTGLYDLFGGGWNARGRSRPCASRSRRFPRSSTRAACSARSATTSACRRSRSRRSSATSRRRRWASSASRPAR